MKQRLLLLLAVLLGSFGTNVVLAEEPTVVVIETLKDYTGTDPYVFNQADGKVYVRNNVGEYERYGIVETTSTLKIAGGGDTEIEYIETLEGQPHPYINTEYIHKANTRIVADVNLTQNSAQSYEAVFGARQNITNHAFIFFSRFGNDDAGCFARATQEAPGTFILPFGEKARIDVQGDSLNVFTEGDDEPYCYIKSEAGFDDGTHPLFIFDLNNGGNVDNSRGYFKLYSFVIFEDETLIMDLRPFVSSTGKAGLKDRVTGKRFFSANTATFAVSPDGQQLIGEAGVTVYEGKIFYNSTDSKIYKYSNGQFQDLGGRDLQEIEFTDYKNMGNWKTNDGHMGIFFGENGCHEYDEMEDVNYFANYSGTAGYEPLMIQIPTNENEDYNFSFDYVGCAYYTWGGRDVPMHVFITNKYDLNTTDAGDVVGGDVLATFKCPFEGTNEEEVHVSMDFTAQKDMETIVAQFGNVEDNTPAFWFEFYSLKVAKYVYPAAAVYPTLNPFGPQIELLLPEVEAFDGSKATPALMEALATAAAEARASLTNEDLLVQRAALEKLQQIFAEVKNTDVTTLRRVIEYCVLDNVDVTEGQRVLAEGMSAAEINQAVFDLRAARKIKKLGMNETYTGAPAEAGEFWLYNVGTGLYLSAGSDWNTHAAVDQTGLLLRAEPAEGGYTLHTATTYPGYAGDSFNGSPYLDTGVNTVYTFQMVEGKENVYNILQGENLLGWNPNGHTDGAHYWSSVSNTAGADAADPNFQWIFVTRAEREAKMETADLQNPVDVTFYLDNPNLLKLPGLDMWEKWAVGGNGGARVSENNNSDRSSDFAYEFWNTDTLHFGQVVEGLKPGVYAISVNAFYRDGDGGHQADILNKGEELLREAYLYANGIKTPLVNITKFTDALPNGEVDIASQPSDYGFFVNWPWEVIEYFEHGYYNNMVMCQVGEDGVLDFGIAKEGKPNYGDWVVLDNFHLFYLGEPVMLQQDVVVNRNTGMGYGVTVADVDLQPAKDFLGVNELTTDMLWFVNPDGSRISYADYTTAEYDGWCNGEGVATNWGSNTKICVKFFQAIPDGKFEICDMNGADEIGATYHVQWAIDANGRSYVYNIEVTFSKATPYRPEIVKTIEITHYETPEVAYSTSEPAPTFDVAEVCEALGIENISEAAAYIVNVTDGGFVPNVTDGWRDANGDACQWGEATNGFCVKLSDPASGEFDYTGAHDANFHAGDTYLAQWGLVYDEKAVLLKVNVIFGEADGIQSIASDKQNVIFDLMGRRVNSAQKGIYIINGKKAAVK